MITGITIGLILGIVIGLTVKHKTASSLNKKSKSTLASAEKLLTNIPPQCILSHFAVAEEYILITKNEGLYYFSSNCSDEMVKSYCPNIHHYFSTTDELVEEVNKIINKP